MKLPRTMLINAIGAALNAVPRIEALPRPSRVPLSFAQQRLWLLSRLAGGSEACHIQAGLRLRGQLDEVTLQSVLEGLVARHEVLRTTFRMEGGELFQQIGLVVGTASANRARSEIEGVIGLFANMLPLRTLLERVNAVALGAQTNHDLPFEQVTKLVNPPRNLAHTPIFQIIIACEDNGEERASLTGLELDYVGVDRVAQRDLALEFAEVGGAICGRLIYATSLFERSTVERFVGYLQQALSRMAADSGQRVWSAPLLLAEEHHRFRAESNPTEVVYPRDHFIQELLEAQEERDPEAIAVGYEDQGLSYLDPNVRATSAKTAFARLNHRPLTPVRDWELRL
ncbi:condensation domain-containing protein [Mesorhizobium neociceri]|uniref:Condensation domain-containing protein n=1 Tax=Mesorhizobium neociceri TaxID=1307853 RepID=A0A838BC17_9HYPH|nr:condensation domain-containing protein [Mesorhizobium neociceri]MBA1143802.1 hypothetical protein [Mesorhizobium neociceri]